MLSEENPEVAPTDDSIDRIARGIGIPACPSILGRFSEEMHQPEPDTRKLAALINGDIALSAALLTLVNSPYYGLRTKATNAHQALSIIGLIIVYQHVWSMRRISTVGWTHCAGTSG
jgi:HD-like signal output (HDOD) protein